MAKITVNTTGTFPSLNLSTDPTAFTGSQVAYAGLDLLPVTCLTDVTINNSTGIYSFVDFCSADMQKLTTPADNSIDSNIVLDALEFFGDPAHSPTTGAPFYGVNGLASNKIEVQFVLVMNGDDTVTYGIGKQYYQGKGFITSIAPTVNPDAPVWVSPIAIAVTGSFTQGITTA